MAPRALRHHQRKNIFIFANQENLQLAKQLLEKAEVTRSFKHVLTERMVEYCYFHEEQTRELDAWLVSLNPGELTKKTRVYLIELCILRGYSKEAFEYVSAYGSDGISPDLLLKMTVRRITETLYEYNETLITLCVRLLQAEQVHETLLRYLCMHYVGPTQDMYNLLCAAYDAKADSKDLAARVVTQMLFTGKIDHLKEASVEQLTEVNDIGEVSALCIRNFFTDEKNIEILDRLKEYGVNMQAEETETVESVLTGKTVVVTGTLPTLGRKEASELIEKYGGKASGSVSKKTDYVLAGENAGSKLTKAQELGIPVISEEQLKEMLGI